MLCALACSNLVVASIKIHRTRNPDIGSDGSACRELGSADAVLWSWGRAPFDPYRISKIVAEGRILHGVESCEKTHVRDGAAKKLDLERLVGCVIYASPVRSIAVRSFDFPMIE